MFQVLLEDIMTENPVKVRDDLTVGQVAHLLLRYRINGVLVVSRNDPEDLMGVFTTTDLLRILDDVFLKGAHKLDEIKKESERLVGEFASRDIVSLQQKDKVTKALALMHHKNIHTIPIFDGEKLVGVIGRHDILNIAFS